MFAYQQKAIDAEVKAGLADAKSEKVREQLDELHERMGHRASELFLVS